MALISASVAHPCAGWGALMLHRLLPSAFVALAVTAAMASAAAQPFTPAVTARAVGEASVLTARIRGYHRGPGAWIGLTPPPASYCPTMREGEAVQKALARLASLAILYRQPGLALRLQSAGDALSDELDEEEEINQLSDIPYTIYPCPAPPAPYPARPVVLRLIEQRAPACRVEANALRVSFSARRTLMQQCLRS
jgi:hypothetical protein